MALKKLPTDVQCILHASSHINTFKKAVEELVYNSIDAESTSIAIRIDIRHYTIQVIDNGHGVLKYDFHAIGHKHMTSKTVDLSTLKSSPKTYGYRGESLANIVAVSQTVKITSRYKDSVETWAKTFCKGKEKKLIEVSKRPSQGTTVDIKGYLYNHHIQKKTIDVLNELSCVKQFLENLSLVHSGISLSLRDDSKNEIIFRMHKTRDVFQALSNLFNIDKSEVRELHVEKNNYKVKGIIGKTGKDLIQTLICLNGKPLCDISRLHKIINNSFKTYLYTTDKTQKNTKLKENHSKAKNDIIVNENIPFYFVFITCPVIDYDISSTRNHSILLFKDWEQITKLLQKLIKFYAGEVSLKEITKPKYELPTHKRTPDKNTRHQVKVIMDQILGNPLVKKGLSQVKNGVKGKLIKRKLRKLPTPHCKTNLKVTKLKPSLKIISENHQIPVLEEIVTGDDDNVFEMETNQNKDISEKNKTYANRRTYHKENLLPNLHKKLKSETRAIKNLNNPRKHSKYPAKKSNNDDENKQSEKYTLNNKKKFNIKCKNIWENKGTPSNKKIADHGSIPPPPRNTCNTITRNKYILAKIKEKSFPTTYDLVQTVLNSQHQLYFKNAVQGLFSDHLNTKRNFTTKYTFDSSFRSKLTFKSNGYHRNDISCLRQIEKTNHTKNDNKRFITRESIDNFAVPSKLSKFQVENQLTRTNLQDKVTRFYDIYFKHTIEESSYTIEHTKSNSINNGHQSNKICTIHQANKFPNTKEDAIKSQVNETYDLLPYQHVNNTTNISINTFENEYRCKLNDDSFKCVLHSTENVITGNTYTVSTRNFNDANYKVDSHNLIEETNRIDYFDYRNYNNDYSSYGNKNDIIANRKHLNVVFISNSQNSDIELIKAHNPEPLELCEPVLEFIESDIIIPEKSLPVISNTEQVSHQQYTANNKNEQNNFEIVEDDADVCNDILYSNYCGQNFIEDSNQDKILETINNESNKKTNDHQNIISNNFGFKDRLRFLPKGMSQIYNICHSKSACDYNLDKKYFENSIYNDFAYNVETNTEIYEPIIQNVKDMTTKCIDKFTDKLKKDNASLIFDGYSIKGAKVLGQVDQKFILAVMKEKSNQLDESIEYLIMFDQHAVHERIRLEKNLGDYLHEDQWKSIPLDTIKLNMTSEEIIYLHNYRAKFTQLGLEWTILDDCEVSFNAIPEAILGKNPREVEKVIRAVKNLIAEEIEILKLQKGCISMHPKAIMDLVFSEACRYAIKFGDRLSRNECVELLQALSDCKVPFQCAHGRPVMAVLMDIQYSKSEYKVDISKIKQFKIQNP